MLPLRDLVRDRLKAMGLRQQDFADRLGVDPRLVSAVLTGERLPPIDQAAEWARTLDLDDAAAGELLDAMHLAAVSDHVRALVDQLADRAIKAEQTLARYRDRHGYIRYILDHVEPVTGGGAPPPPPPSPEVLAALIDALVQQRNWIVHGRPLRVAESITPPLKSSEP